MDLEDTIVAVSSPAGAGERAILRLSGPRAMEIAEQVFAPDCHRGLVKDSPTHVALPGRLEPPGSGLSVPALVYLMRAPRSYTRQDDSLISEYPTHLAPIPSKPMSSPPIPAKAEK